MFYNSVKLRLLEFKKFREIKENAKKDFYRKISMIGGKDIIVEVDESKFGKGKYKRGRLVDGVLVVGMVIELNRDDLC